MIDEFMTSHTYLEHHLTLLVNKIAIGLPSLKDVAISNANSPHNDIDATQRIQLVAMWHSTQESLRSLREEISSGLSRLNAPVINLIRYLVTREMEHTTTLNSTGGFLRTPQTFGFEVVEPAMHVTGYGCTPYGSDRSHGPPIGMSPFRGNTSILESHNNRSGGGNMAAKAATAAATTTTTTTTTTTAATRTAAARTQQQTTPPLPSVNPFLPSDTPSVIEDIQDGSDDEYEEVRFF